jgi:hypothetical protein
MACGVRVHERETFNLGAYQRKLRLCAGIVGHSRYIVSAMRNRRKAPPSAQL